MECIVQIIVDWKQEPPFHDFRDYDKALPVKYNSGVWNLYILLSKNVTAWDPVVIVADVTLVKHFLKGENWIN